MCWLWLWPWLYFNLPGLGGCLAGWPVMSGVSVRTDWPRAAGKRRAALLTLDASFLASRRTGEAPLCYYETLAQDLSGFKILPIRFPRHGSTGELSSRRLYFTLTTFQPTIDYSRDFCTSSSGG